jgi:AraC-like DNA-binding protein
MSTGSRRRAADTAVVANYYASRLPGLSCSTLVDEGPPRARVYDRFVLLTLAAGEALVWCRGETHALAPGSVLMIEPGDVHRDIQKTPYCALMVMLRADLVDALCGRDEGARLESSVVRCATLCAEAAGLVEAVQAGHDLAAQERRTLRLFGLLAPLWTQTAARPEPPLVARARRALADSPAAMRSLDELAARLGCAPSYLCRVFSEHTGVGPHAYQLQQRLLEAGRLIESGRTVATAAALTGFGDASHLRRHFRRRFAVSPGRYQKELAQVARTPPRADDVMETDHTAYL